MSFSSSNRRQDDGGEEASVPMVDRRWRTVFNELDTRKEGSIPMESLRQRIASADLSNQLTQRALSRIMRKADADGNQRIDYDQFRNLMNSPEIANTRVALALRRINKYSYTMVVPRNQRPGGMSAKKPRVGVDGTGSGIQDEEDIDYDHSMTCWPPPLFTILISIAELAVFIYYVVHESETISMSGPVPWDSPLIYNPTKRYQAWRFLTYMFIHAGFVHIIFNLLIQLILGIPLEMVHKYWRVAAVYISGVMFGSMVTSVFDPKVYLAGASGGVYALITAHISTIIMNWREMEFPLVRIIMFLIFIITDVSVAIYNRYAKGEVNNVGYAAHFGGALAGLLVGIFILKNIKLEKWENKLWWASVTICVALFLAILVWNCLGGGHFPPTDWS